MSDLKSLETLIGLNWSGDEAHWLNTLVDADLIGFEWPEPFGANWSRDEQLTWIKLLAAHQCPLMPESLSVIAPLLVRYGTDQQKAAYLPAIRSDPVAWRFESGEPSAGKPTCWLECSDTADSLWLSVGDAAPQILGTQGQGTVQLAQAVSPALLLHEYIAGIRHLQSALAGFEETSQVADLKLQEDILCAHFLRDTPRTDAQLSLLVSRSRLTLFSELFSALGYYALIEPTSQPGDNEPIPLASERAHLSVLRKLTARDEMLQQDQIYKDDLNAATD